MTVVRKWPAVAASWIAMYLFHAQPGFDPVSFLHWLREAYFSSYKSMLVSLTIIILNGAWVLPHIVYGIIYHIQHPFFEQYSLQVWPWENAEAEAAARRGDPPVPPSVPVPSALGVRAITQARKPASAFYAQIKHGFQWVFTEHVYQSCVTTLGMHYILRNVSETALKAYIDSIPGVPVRCVQMLIGCFLFETIFYWGHRLLHHPKLYSVHKDHHSFYTPVVVNSKFFHPIDTFFSSTLPGISPFFLFWDDFHIYTFWCWSTMQIFHSAYVHSGYDFPFNPFMLIPFADQGAHHNFHHSHNVDNFGALWHFWDDWCGTNQAWSKHEDNQRKALAEAAAAEAKLNNTNSSSNTPSFSSHSANASTSSTAATTTPASNMGVASASLSASVSVTHGAVTRSKAKAA